MPANIILLLARQYRDLAAALEEIACQSQSAGTVDTDAVNCCTENPTVSKAVTSDSDSKVMGAVEQKDQADKNNSPQITFDDLHTMCTHFCASDETGASSFALERLINSYGVQKLSKVPEDKYPEIQLFISNYHKKGDPQ